MTNTQPNNTNTNTNTTTVTQNNVTFPDRGNVPVDNTTCPTTTACPPIKNCPSIIKCTTKCPPVIKCPPCPPITKCPTTTTTCLPIPEHLITDPTPEHLKPANTLVSLNDCASLPDNVFLTDARHCRRFYICQRGRTKRQHCSLSQWFDRETLTCRDRKLVTNCPAKRS
ncbi:mucin-2-like [Musca vetustissima]|uniref:mucin-2-like n=1 Tax=Musca vetustissima TaxID=27455 RepID=UPI002AB60D13|nr:mucin-2-like [Musca vetustissima]